MAEEIWKPVVGFETYQVSNLGRIKNSRGQIRKQGPGSGGRMVVVFCVGNKLTTRQVHQIVCEAFHGVKPFPKAQALHKNDEHLDNREDNLYWGTHQQNMDDRSLNGKTAQGEDHYNASLNWEKVREIRRRYAARELSQPKLAKLYGVTQTCIFNIVHNKQWKE